VNGAVPPAEPDEGGGCVNGLDDVPTAVAGGVLTSDCCPNENVVDIAGADAVRLKLKALLDVSTLGASFANVFATELGAPNVNPGVDDPLD